MIRRRGTGILIVLLLASPAVAAPFAPKPGVLAEVGGEKVTTDEFRALLGMIRGAGDPGGISRTMIHEGREQILQELIETLLLAREARSRRLDQDPRIAFRLRQAEATILAEALVEREIAGIDLSDARLFDYYRSHQGEFRDAAKIRARHIVVASRAEAETAQRRLREGADFAALARELNIDDTRTGGGDLGWVPRGVMVREFETALFALAPGETSGPVRTRFGFHIIRAEESAAERTLPFTQVREIIRKRLAAQHLDLQRREIRSKVPVTIDRELLKSMGED